MPNILHASGISSSEPPATPDAPQAHSDATTLSREARRQLRQKIQFVYQNPFASLDPRQTLFEIIEEPLKNFSRLGKAQRKLRVETVAQRVALPVEFLTRTAREL